MKPLKIKPLPKVGDYWKPKSTQTNEEINTYRQEQDDVSLVDN